MSAKKRVEPEGVSGEATADDIRDLFSYNLQRLAGISTRIALLDIKPRFGLNMHDWRALAVLAYLGPAPLNLLAQRAGVQKSQMSRTVAMLEKRGYIARDHNPSDKRSALLLLTRSGRSVADQVLAASQLRNRRMLKYLDRSEQQQIMTLMEKVVHGSLEALAELRGRKGGTTQTIAKPAPPRALFELEPP